MPAASTPSGHATARTAARLAWTGGAPQWTKTAWSADSSFLALSGTPGQVLTRSWDGTNGGRAFASADGGSTWSQIGSADGDMDILSVALVEGGMLAGTWNGLYGSTNGGASWTALAPTGLPADTAIWSLATVGSTLFAGTAGHVYKSLDEGASFADASTGIPATAIVRSFVAAGSKVFATTNSDGIFATTNGGTSWAAASSGLTDTRVSQLVVSGSKTLAVTLGGLFVSSNGGATWAADVSGLEKANCLLVASDQLLAGTEDDGVFSSMDDGATWATASAGMTAGVRVWSLAATSNDVFAATDAGIWRASMVPNAAPTIATPAAATPSPVTGTTASLSVLGADDGGEPALTYTWAVVGTPPAAVVFAANGTNTAKSTTATFAAAGTYTLAVTVRDLPGLTAASQVVVVVDQTLASLLVTPASASVSPLGAQQFVAGARDQFGAALATQPPVTWSVSAGGTIDGNGLFTAGESLGGPFTVTATSGAVTGVATVEVAIPNVAPTIATAAAATPNPVTGTTATLSVLGDDDAGEPNLTYTWATMGTPPGVVTFSANASNAAKTTTATFTQAGSYTFQVTVTDQPGASVTSSVTVTVGQTATTIVVSPASATVNAQATLQLTATARDQFGTNLATQPTFTWTVSGGGTIGSTGLFTAGSTAGTYTVTATGASLGGTAAVTVSSAPVAVYQINCGGSAASPYIADQYASGGTKRTVTNAITMSGITNPAPQAVYQAERYGAITYTLPNLTSGRPYTVRLHFAELYWTATGKRRFNVVINGATVLSSFDIYAAAGARYKALVREFTATANASGQIVINFQTVTDNATIEGIEVITSTPNGAPTIATGAAASPNPVTGTTAALSVLGADDGGEANLSYTWATTGTPPAAVTFSTNGTNAAKATTATFSKAGSYTLQVTVKDQPGLTATSTVAVTVDQSLTSIAVTPSSASLAPLGTQQFAATARDQFATALTTQPTFTWTASGGAINPSGLYTAGASAGGPYTVTAASGASTGTATVTVETVNAAPTIATAAAATPSSVTGTTAALSVLGADDGGEANLSYTWATTGTPPAAVTYSANGSNAAKSTTATFTKAGSYTFQATVKDLGNLTATSQVTVTVNQTLTSVVVAPASATVNASATQQFTATARDQFTTNLTPQPTFTWTVSGGGTINTSGLFTAGASAGGPYTVTATGGGKSGTASVTVTAASTSPCDGLCTSPVVFTSANYQSGNLGTGATCHQTTANLMGGNCSNISARTLKVNNITMSCNGWALPAKRNGGYCIQVTAGTPDYTSFATW